MGPATDSAGASRGPHRYIAVWPPTGRCARGLATYPLPQEPFRGPPPWTTACWTASTPLAHGSLAMIPTLPRALGKGPGQFEFSLDQLGRTIVAEGWLSDHAAPRDASAQSLVAAHLPGYHAGHLIPARFGGPGCRQNLVPVPAVINVSYVKAVENAIARHRADGPVYLRVAVEYSGQDPVPRQVVHEFFRRRRGGLERIPGGEVLTAVKHVPAQAMGSMRDPYTGRRISPKDFLDPSNTRGLGAHGAH
jgi:hypothetical protein